MSYSLIQNGGKFIKFGDQWICKIKPMYTLTLQNTMIEQNIEQINVVGQLQVMHKYHLTGSNEYK